MQLFVLGSPRSGTTLVGNFAASHPRCSDLGEYYGFFLALRQAPQLMQRVPTPKKDDYLEWLFASTCEFADRTLSGGRVFWVDHTPLNLLVGSALAERLPGALFVLMLRHYRGVVQSLRRSYAEGYRWAGSQIGDSAALWAEYYAHAAALPPDRTLVLSYDRLCADPEPAIRRAGDFIAARCGVEPAGFDPRVLATSFATTSQRSTIARQDGDRVVFSPIASYDRARWTDGMEAVCRPAVGRVDEELRARYPDEYVEPVSS
jgi:Sulfotransferase family